VKTHYLDSYRVSPRVVLTPGTRFRARGGPMIRLSTGETVSMSAKGPFLFVRHCKRGTCEWLDALDRDGNYAPLHVAGRRRKITAAMVLRKYCVTGTVRGSRAKP
jgi:hypothetical protein